MAKPRVYVTRRLDQQAMDRIEPVADMEVWEEELPPPYDIIREKAREADGLLTLLSDKIDSALMEDAPHLKVVSNYAVGYDNIDVEGATRNGIFVGNTPGVLTETTADFLLLILPSHSLWPQPDVLLKPLTILYRANGRHGVQ